MKKYTMLLCLMLVAPSAMASHDGGPAELDQYRSHTSTNDVANCAVWATGADGKAYCQSSGSSSNNHNHNNNNNNQGCGGFNQQDCGWPNGQPMSPW